MVIKDRAGDESLKKLLSYWKRVSVVENYQRKTKPVLEALHIVRDKDLLTYPGLLYRVITHLTSQGIKYSIQDLRTPHVELDVERAMEGLWEIQRPIVYKAIKSRGGVVSAPTGLGKTVMAAAIIRAYPKQDLMDRGTPICVFTCPDRDINAKNFEEFKELFPDREVGICQSGRKHIFTEDIMVVTLDSLSNLDMSQVGVLICDEVHAGVSDSRTPNLTAAKKADMYGVSATPGGRYDGKDLTIEAIFGPIVSTTTYQDGVDAGVLVPIKVVWIEVPEPDNLLQYKMLQTRQGKINRGIINNNIRSKLVADVIKGIPEDMQTLAITATVKHISKIRFHFPELRVCHAETSEEGMKSKGVYNVPVISNKERKAIYDDMRDGNIPKIISTYVYKQGVNFPNLEVVVAAGGAGSEIVGKQVPGRASRTAKGKDGAVVVDFWHPWDVDRHGKNGPIHVDDRKRRKYYKDLGFDQVWCSSLNEALTEISKTGNTPEGGSNV